MIKFLIGASGKLILIGGKPLSSGPGDVVPGITESITLTPFVFGSTGTGRFQVHTTAASDDTVADVPFIFTYTGAQPTSVYARIVDSTGNTAITAWTNITNSVRVNSDGNCLGYLPSVPPGIGYRREIRVGTAGISNKDLAAKTFNVGVMGLPWGQSNMYNQLVSDRSAATIVPGTTLNEATYYTTNGTGAFFGKNGFVGSSNNNTIGSYETHWAGGLIYLRQLGALLARKFSRKVGFAINPWAQKGTGFGGFVRSDNSCDMIDFNGAIGGTIGLSSLPQYASGDYRFVLWHQGETSATGENTRADRLANLKKLCQAHLNHVWTMYGRPPSKLTFLFAIMGVGNPTQMENLRGAVMDLIDYAKQPDVGWDVRIGWNCIDLQAGSDSLHLTGVYQTMGLFRMIQCSMNVLDPLAVPLSAEGPYFPGVKSMVGAVKVLTGIAARNGNVVTVSVADKSDNHLVARDSTIPITGVSANTAPDFTGTDLLVNSVTISDMTILVDVTDSNGNDAPTTFYIKFAGGRYGLAASNYPNTTNWIYNTMRYPTGVDASEQFVGLPLHPTPDPIKVG